VNVEPISLAAAAVAFVATFALGLFVGRKSRSWPAWRYWAANAVSVLVGVAIAAYGFMTQNQWVWIGGFGAIAGSLSGLKYGLGRVVGQWRDVALDDDDAGESPGHPSAS
jgi:hypothetical protein